MSEDDEKYWPHPLLPWLTAAALTSAPPLVPYAPMAEFRRLLDRAAIVHPLMGEDEAKRHILATYHHSMALARVIAAGGGSDLYGDELHAIIYRAAEANPFADALCDAAATAFRMGYLPSFVVASRLPGFGKAWQAWAQHFGCDIPFNGPDQLEHINRNVIQSDKPGADFWLKACQMGYPSPKAFTQDLAEKVALANDADRKQTERDAKRTKPKRPPPRFKNDIAAYWLPLSFWARRASVIAFLIDPGNAGDERVKKDISDLKFSDSHRGDLQDFIDRAEK